MGDIVKEKKVEFRNRLREAYLFWIKIQIRHFQNYLKNIEYQ